MKKLIIIGTSFVLVLALSIWTFGVFDKQPEGHLQAVYNETQISDDISWQEKASNATKAFIEVNKDTIAKTIINLTHPTAVNAIVAEYKVFDKEGGIVQVYLTIAFQGNLSNKNYKQTGTWSFSKGHENVYKIVEDSAPFSSRKKSVERLQTWFKTELFPRLKQSI